MQRVPRDHRHHHVQLELPCLGGGADGGVAADHLVADLVHHLRDRRIHLARHDRRARLHRGQDDLRDPGARSAGEQPEVARDLRKLHRHPPHRARIGDHVAHALRDAKPVGGGDEVHRKRPREVRDREPCVVVAGVQPGADRGRAEVQLLQLLRRLLDIVGAALDARGPAAELLAERHRHRVLQVRPAHLQHVRERARLLLQRRRQAARGVHERPHADEQRDARRRGEHVVGGLSHVHVVVRVDERVLAARAAEDFGGAIGNHLVRVHVVRGAGARLVHVDDELIAQRPGADLVGRAHDGVRDARVETPERLVGFGRGPLDQDRGGDQIGGRAQVADAEIRDRPGGLDAVVRIGGNVELTERVALGSKRHSG